MRVTLVTSKLNFVTAGGSVADLHLKARGLVELGHEVTVVTAFSRANKINQALPYKVAEENIALSGGLLPIQYGVYKMLKKYQSKTDIFYIDGHIFLYGGGWYRKMGGAVPVVAFFNIRLNCWGDTSGNVTNPGVFKKVKRGLRKTIEKLAGVPIANHLDKFIFNTPQVEKMYTDWGFIKDKSTVIEDFVDTKSIQTQAASYQKAPNATVTFLTAGRMIKEKGFDLVLKAAAALPNKNNFKIIMSGGGPELENLVRQAKELKLDKQVSLPGWVNKEQLAEYFKNCDVFIFPKWWIEYGSAVLTEAMAYGLPLIIPGGGALEWLAQKAAITFTPDSVESLQKQMEQTIYDAALRSTLATESKKRIQALDCQVLAKKLETVLSQAK